MSELSPAAQAVLDAASEVYWDWTDMSPASSQTIAAAALRAAADHGEIFFDAYDSPVLVVTVDDLLAIAGELEAQ